MNYNAKSGWKHAWQKRRKPWWMCRAKYTVVPFTNTNIASLLSHISSLSDASAASFVFLLLKLMDLTNINMYRSRLGHHSRIGPMFWAASTRLLAFMLNFLPVYSELVRFCLTVNKRPVGHPKYFHYLAKDLYSLLSEQIIIVRNYAAKRSAECSLV